MEHGMAVVLADLSRVVDGGARCRERPSIPKFLRVAKLPPGAEARVRCSDGVGREPEPHASIALSRNASGSCLVGPGTSSDQIMVAIGVSEAFKWAFQAVSENSKRCRQGLMTRPSMVQGLENQLRMLKALGVRKPFLFRATARPERRPK
jgi:hypothetical protein